MQSDDFLRDQFLSLRDEIKATKARLFWIVTFGLFGVPVLAYFSSLGEEYVSMLVPYFILVLVIMFVAEQNALMRAGRYIREQIEPKATENGWESWLESRNDLRMMDRHFFACFTIVFFVYYFMTIGMVMQTLMADKDRGPEALGQTWFYGASVTYAIGAVWMISTLVHHWKSCVQTSD